MSTAFKSSWHEVSHALGRRPVWLPGTPMKLGDVGWLDDGGWTKQTTLRDLGIDVSREPDGPPTDLNYVSHDGATIVAHAGATAGAAAGVPAQAAGSFAVSFSRAGALLLRANQARVRRIGDVGRIAEVAVQRYLAGNWDRRWVIVTEVTEGTQVVVIVAGSSSASAQVDLGAKVPAAADATVALQVSRGENLAASFSTADRTAVLWRGHFVRDPLLRSPSLEQRGDAPARPAPPGARVRLTEIEAPEDVQLDDRG